MGRSSGSSHSSGGGSSHSSGGFGGGHSTGGFSIGGRSSGGASSRGRSSGRSSGPNSRPPRSPGYHHGPINPMPGPGPMHRRPHYHHRPGVYVYRNESPWVVFVIFFIIVMFIMLMTFTGNPSKQTIKNTTERVALKGVVSKTDWYQDDIGWITSKNKLIKGLEKFYNETGVQPYILLVPYSAEYWNGDELNGTKADEYLEKVYKEKFKDEGHFIFAYFECENDSKAEMEGEFKYLSGYSADTIMDNEAINILWGYFENNYYDTSLTIEEMFSNTFSQTAKSIMSKPTNGWDFAKIFIIVIVIIVIIVFIYKMTKNKHKREKEKEEFTEKILEKPLETFGKDTSELEKKYEDK